ncbi:MAG: hypothetical protein QOH63_3346 [Acidobacteriota bacterium]|jgi:hypothetical protein|nr:hypothetical protein [Acidobacteriota bacterium]
MDIISIIPRLPPATDGLGDYGLNLACQLRNDFGVESHFIVSDTNWIGEGEVKGFSISKLASRSAVALLSNLTNSEPLCTVLLHYVGYGYARRGAPVWLVDGLEKWRTGNEEARLLTMFHEVYASGPLWTSAFWLSSLQKHLAARLSRLSDACLTSRQGYAEILNALSRNKHNSIATLPVFSNIGEPEQTPPLLKDRRRRLVVFGGRSNRLRVYENSLAALEKVCRALAIEEIFDVGPPTGLVVSQINSVPVIEMGERPAAEISDLLSDAVAGFFDYNTAYLAKSTIFAAYSAHRLIPISASCDAAAQVDGLEARKHYWAANSHDKTLSLADGQEIADNAYAWYQAHKLSEHVKTFAGEIRRTQKSGLSLAQGWIR